MKEKSQFEKNAADKQVELLSGALNGAVSAGGHWLNAMNSDTVSPPLQTNIIMMICIRNITIRALNHGSRSPV